MVISIGKKEQVLRVLKNNTLTAKEILKILKERGEEFSLQEVKTYLRRLISRKLVHPIDKERQEFKYIAINPFIFNTIIEGIPDEVSDLKKVLIYKTALDLLTPNTKHAIEKIVREGIEESKKLLSNPEKINQLLELKNQL